MRLINCVLAIACCAAIAAQGQEPKPSVSGVTVDSKGAPVRKTDLLLTPLPASASGPPMPSYSMIAASDGKFEFYGVPPGRYRLQADHAGFLRARYGAKTPWGSGTILTLRQGLPLTGLEIRMTEQATISGKVHYDGDAGSLYLILLQEKFQDGRRRMTATSSASAEASGEFLFKRLAPGRYYLLARTSVSLDAPPDEEVALPTFYPGTLDQGAAELIVVRGGQTASVELTVKKSRAFRVSGSLSPLPPNGARVSLTLRTTADDIVSTASAATVGADGSFQFNPVPPGSYLIAGSLPGAPEPRLIQQPIDIRSDVTGLFVAPAQYPSLHGSVKVEGGATAVPRLRVGLQPGSPAIQSATAQATADGSLNFGPVSPGLYRFQFSGLPAGAYLKSAKLGDKDALPGIDLTQAPSDARLELVVSYAGARIEGVILDDQGKPAEGIACLVPDPPQPEMSWLYRTADAAEDGQFRFQGVRPGKYRVYAWEELETGTHMDPEVTAPREAYSVAVEAGENESKRVTVKRIAADTPTNH